MANGDRIRVLVADDAATNQVLNNLDEVVGPKVKDDPVETGILERTIKRPIMQSVGTLRTLRVAIQNPGLSPKG